MLNLRSPNLEKVRGIKRKLASKDICKDGEDICLQITSLGYHLNTCNKILNMRRKPIDNQCNFIKIGVYFINIKLKIAT